MKKQGCLGFSSVCNTAPVDCVLDTFVLDVLIQHSINLDLEASVRGNVLQSKISCFGPDNELEAVTWCELLNKLFGI